MSDSKPGPPRPNRTGKPQAALDALLGDAAFDPLRRALWLDALDQRLRPCLPPALAPHARLANLDGGKLVFVVDAPVWRASLRLAAPEVLDAARSLGLGVTELVVKTTLPASPPQRVDLKVRPMSAAAQADLRAALASLKDPEATGSEGS